MSKLLELSVNRNAEASYNSKKYSKTTVLIILFSRTFLFVVFQFCFYVFFSLLGKDNPWMMSAAYWPFVMILSNIVCAILLSVLLKLH